MTSLTTLSIVLTAVFVAGLRVFERSRVLGVLPFHAMLLLLLGCAAAGARMLGLLGERRRCILRQDLLDLRHLRDGGPQYDERAWAWLCRVEPAAVARESDEQRRAHRCHERAHVDDGHIDDYYGI